jgi:hypothetical protein
MLRFTKTSLRADTIAVLVLLIAALIWFVANALIS